MSNPVYNPNGGEELKLFTVFRENGWELPFSQLTLFISITIRSSILYMRAISGYFAVLAQNFFLKVWIHWQNHSFEANSTSEVFKYPLTKTPCSFKCFLSSATFIALKSLLFFFSAILKLKVFHVRTHAVETFPVYIICHVTLDVKSNA